MTQAVISQTGALTLASLNSYNASGQRVSRVDGTWDISTDDANSNGLFDANEIQDAVTTKFYYTESATLYTTGDAE